MQAHLGFSDFEMDVLLVAFAVEVDLRYERLYAWLQDDATRRRPSVALALDLLCESVGSSSLRATSGKVSRWANCPGFV